MRTTDLFTQKTVFSLEVFPPKRDMPLESIYPTLQELSRLHPDFISVTCGANGQGGNRTAEVAATIKHTYHCETVAHLPCLYLTEDDVRHTLQELRYTELKIFWPYAATKRREKRRSAYLNMRPM